jgi:hypothetical protein
VLHATGQPKPNADADDDTHRHADVRVRDTDEYAVWWPHADEHTLRCALADAHATLLYAPG